MLVVGLKMDDSRRKWSAMACRRRIPECNVLGGALDLRPETLADHLTIIFRKR